MFRTAIITDEISQNLETAVSLAKEYKLDGVEIRSVWNKDPFSLTEEEGKEIRRIVADAGLEICGISAPFYKCSLDRPEEIRAHREGLTRCIKLAKQWHTGIIRGFPFWKCQDSGARLAEIAEQFRAPAKQMLEEGLTLAVESDPGVNACSGAQLARIVDEIACPAVKALWDPGNDIYAPEEEIPYPDGYAALQGRIAHVHVKDAVKDQEGKAVGCCLGDGLVDWKGQLAALKADRYEGWLVLEPHYRLQAALSKQQLERPGGAGFSAEGEEPSRRCMERLNKTIEEIR